MLFSWKKALMIAATESSEEDFLVWIGGGKIRAGFGGNGRLAVLELLEELFSLGSFRTSDSTADFKGLSGVADGLAP